MAAPASEDGAAIEDRHAPPASAGRAEEPDSTAAQVARGALEEDWILLVLPFARRRAMAIGQDHLIRLRTHPDRCDLSASLTTASRPDSRAGASPRAPSAARRCCAFVGRRARAIAPAVAAAWTAHRIMPKSFGELAGRRRAGGVPGKPAPSSEFLGRPDHFVAFFLSVQTCAAAHRQPCDAFRLIARQAAVVFEDGRPLAQASRSNSAAFSDSARSPTAITAVGFLSAVTAVARAQFPLISRRARSSQFMCHPSSVCP